MGKGSIVVKKAIVKYFIAMKRAMETPNIV